MDVAAQILIAISGQCRKLLTSLVSFRMKYCLSGEKGDFGVVRICLLSDQFIVDVCAQLLKLKASKPREFHSCRLSGVGFFSVRDI